MRDGLGYEFAKFRLKADVDKQILLEASAAMDAFFFPQQEGFISHTLVELGGGEYVDIVVAVTKEHAEKICGKWQGDQYCEAFLAAVDPETVSIGFGASVSYIEKAA